MIGYKCGHLLKLAMKVASVAICGAGYCYSNTARIHKLFVSNVASIVEVVRIKERFNTISIIPGRQTYASLQELAQHILCPRSDHVPHFLQNLHRSSSTLNLKKEHIFQQFKCPISLRKYTQYSIQNLQKILLSSNTQSFYLHDEFMNALSNARFLLSYQSILQHTKQEWHIFITK
jgi:hypothetical protein